jgi:hypothetical protein
MLLNLIEIWCGVLQTGQTHKVRLTWNSHMPRRLVPFEQSLHCKFNKARYCSLEQEPTPVTDSTTKITVGAVDNYPAFNRNSSLLRNRHINHRIFKILSQNLSPFRITMWLTLLRSYSFKIYFNIFLSSKVNDSGEIINTG